MKAIQTLFEKSFNLYIKSGKLIVILIFIELLMDLVGFFLQNNLLLIWVMLMIFLLYFSYSASLPLFIADISALAEQDQASISGIQFRPLELTRNSQPTKNPTVESLGFTINTTGSYINLANFLHDLGHFNHLVTVDSANFNKPLGDDLTLSIVGKTYYLKN